MNLLQAEIDELVGAHLVGVEAPPQDVEHGLSGRTAGLPVIGLVSVRTRGGTGDVSPADMVGLWVLSSYFRNLSLSLVAVFCMSDSADKAAVFYNLFSCNRLGRD